MRQRITLMGCLALLGASMILTQQRARVYGQDSSLPTPFAKAEAAEQLLTFFNNRGGHPAGATYRSEPSRHAVLVALEAAHDTTAYVSTPVIDHVRDDIRKEIVADLETALWADLNCVPGEGGVIEASLNRAQRFGPASLPILWQLRSAQLGQGHMISDPDRAQKYVNLTMERIVEKFKDRKSLVKALDGKPGLEDLAKWVKELPLVQEVKSGD